MDLNFFLKKNFSRKLKGICGEFKNTSRSYFFYFSPLDQLCVHQIRLHSNFCLLKQKYISKFEKTLWRYQHQHQLFRTTAGKIPSCSNYHFFLHVICFVNTRESKAKNERFRRLKCAGFPSVQVSNRSSTVYHSGDIRTIILK